MTASADDRVADEVGRGGFTKLRRLFKEERRVEILRMELMG